MSFSCRFLCSLPCLSALTPAYSYTCWCTNIYGKMTKAKFSSNAVDHHSRNTNPQILSGRLVGAHKNNGMATNYAILQYHPSLRWPAALLQVLLQEKKLVWDWKPWRWLSPQYTKYRMLCLVVMFAFLSPIGQCGISFSFCFHGFMQLPDMSTLAETTCPITDSAQQLNGIVETPGLGIDFTVNHKPIRNQLNSTIRAHTTRSIKALQSTSTKRHVCWSGVIIQRAWKVAAMEQL